MAKRNVVTRIWGSSSILPQVGYGAEDVVSAIPYPHPSAEIYSPIAERAAHREEARRRRRHPPVDLIYAGESRRQARKQNLHRNAER
jgi:hypothetical protein